MGSKEDLHLLGEGYEPRAVEHGARLVATLKGRPLVVVQLPRGNLEAVYPRALVLPHVMGSVMRGEYREALDVMRKQMVDTNIMVDMDMVLVC